MTRFVPVALALSLGFGSVLSAQQPGPISASLEREAARLASSLGKADLTRDRSTAFSAPADQIDKVRSGGQVRITAASVVELPGLARLESTSIVLGSILSSDDDTVTVGGSGGQVVTLLRPRHRIAGRLDQMDAQTFTVAREHGPTVTVPRTGIAKLERPNGMRSRIWSAGVGLLIGAVGGGGIGWLVGSNCRPQVWFDCFLQPEASSAAGGVLAGGAGALVGALVPPRQRWRTVPLSSLAGMFATPP